MKARAERDTGLISSEEEDINKHRCTPAKKRSAERKEQSLTETVQKPQYKEI